MDGSISLHGLQHFHQFSALFLHDSSGYGGCIRGYHHLTAICWVCCGVFSVGGLVRGSGLVLISTSPRQCSCYVSTESQPTTVADSCPRRRCLHSSTVIRRLTSTSGLRHWPLPLPSSMRKWRSFFTDTDPTSHRVRLWRGGSASSLFFYLFVYSFVEYVDMGTSTYIKAPGPYCGAEGKMADLWPDRFSLCLRAVVFVSLFPVVYNVSPLSFNN